jgi:hypothetical protein
VRQGPILVKDRKAVGANALNHADKSLKTSRVASATAKAMTPPLLGSTLLIAIKSPLQALNAVEYYHHLQPPPTLVQAVIFLPKNRPELENTLKQLLSRIPRARVHVLRGIPSEHAWWRSPKEFIKARRFIHNLKVVTAEIPEAQVLALGDYRSRECRYLTDLLPSARVVLLDDGSATHQIARYRRDPSDPRLAPMFPRNNLRTLRLRLWAGIRAPFIRHVAFFTHYRINPPTSDGIIVHQYEFWRSVLARNQPSVGDQVLFLGMSHVEKGLTDLTRYLTVLAQIRAYYGSRRLLYRPHRDETPAKLDEVARLGFIITTHDPRPVELLLIEGSTLPSEVASIASSALDNLAVILAGKIILRCFLPASGYCTSPMAGHFSDILNYHRDGHGGYLQATALSASPTSAPEKF